MIKFHYFKRIKTHFTSEKWKRFPFSFDYFFKLLLFGLFFCDIYLSQVYKRNKLLWLNSMMNLTSEKGSMCMCVKQGFNLILHPDLWPLNTQMLPKHRPTLSHSDPPLTPPHTHVHCCCRRKRALL